MRHTKIDTAAKSSNRSGALPPLYKPRALSDDCDVTIRRAKSTQFHEYPSLILLSGALRNKNERVFPTVNIRAVDRGQRDGGM